MSWAYQAAAWMLWGCLTAAPAVAQGMASSGKSARPARPLPKGMVPPRADFRDIAAAAGLTAVNISGNAERKNYIVETTGNGVALLDYDGDGLLDILLLNAGRLDDPQPVAHHLYRNLGKLKFAEATKEAGLPPSRWAQGACAGDFDNDGKVDLVITEWGANKLLRNLGGQFADESKRLPAGPPRWSTGCAFLDYDRDGDLDLFVANYLRFDLKATPKPGDKAQCMWKGMPVVCGPRGLPAESMSLYRNDGGQFVDVSDAAGITTAKSFYGFTVLTADFDNDGWTDVYVACDSTASLMFRNKRNGTFEEMGLLSGAAFNEDGREQAGMGAAAADYDGDGLIDIFKTNFSDDTPTLYRNTGDLTFLDVTVAAGLAVNTKYLGWGAAFLDFDHDGWKDIFYVNGHVYPEVTKASIQEQFHQRRVLMWNRGDGEFHDLSAEAGAGVTTPHASRGMAVGDLDNDGTLEVLILNMHEAPSLLKNFAPAGNSILVEARTAESRAALGARVTLTLPGKKPLIDEVRSGGFHISQGDFRVHFGMGKAAAGELSIRWPGGEVEKLGTVNSGQWVTAQKGKGIVRKQPFEAQTAP